MASDILSYILLIGIVGGGIWGITIKVKEFFGSVKKNGWHPIRKKIRDFFVTILHLTIYTLIGIEYLSGFVLIPLYFSRMLENENYTNSFIFTYLFLGLLALYYVNGIKRRETKSIITILKQDFSDFKKGLKGFIQGVGTLVKGLFVGFLALMGLLLVIGAIILAFVLFGWFVASLSATTIIVILLFLILLK